LVPEASSVHHTDYPVVDEDTIDEDLERSMAVARTVVTLGRSLRSDHSIGVRQPLARLAVITRDPEVTAAVRRHGAVIAEELNVKEIGTRDDELSVVELAAKANYKRLGPRLGAAVREVAAALEILPSDQVASLLEAGGMTIAGHELSADDVVVTRNPRPGLAVASDGSLSVALDTVLTGELRSEGLAREVVSRIQRARRDLGLEVTDRIRLRYQAGDDLLGEAIRTHAGFISGEVLAVEILSGHVQGGMRFEIGDSTLSVRLEKAAA
ncbi:MAG: DUF5915 domain-containing protein, partial [bacterium]|nr:DUF5915 domain-containing protein [bacterium]